MSYKPVDSSYMRVVQTLLDYVQECFPSAVSQIMLMTSTADAKDFMMRTLANTFRQALRSLSGKDSMDLWQKLHPLFQLKMEMNETVNGGPGKMKIKPEELTIADIHQQLFKLETHFQKEDTNIDFALQKLEQSRKQTALKI